ncbi:MAG: M48 family metalloprotease [Lactobacillus sp.]|nr:M48 family metalloprotease [Lactobacillus sp.]
MDDILAYLFKHAFENKISCALIWKDVNYQSVALPDKKIIVINQNCKNKNELPFIVGHEIGHIMNGDSNAAFYCGKPVNSEEHLADLYSLNLIYNYATTQYDSFSQPYIFLQQYGIPIRMLDDAYDLFKKHDDLDF